ncbi:MAG TPA: sugar phosphate isomerase/epimerase [Roseiarcus sp.]
MPYPPFSISETTTYPATFEEDLAAYKTAGVEGIGIWEFKLPKGQDERSLEALQASGLKATICVPEVPCIMPDAYFREPRDPLSRRKALCAAIRRFAFFKPVGVMVLSGAPGDDPVKDRRTIVEGLKAAADAAGEAGVELGFEAIRKDAGSIISTLPETLGLLEDIGAPNIRVIFDAWHFWDLPNIVSDLQKYADRFICIQVNDRRRPRSWADRLLPGDGDLDLPAFFGALDAGGFKGWYDLEVFSDDGRWAEAYPDSIYKLKPVDVATKAVAGFRKAWDRRKAPAG